MYPFPRIVYPSIYIYSIYVVYIVLLYQLANWKWQQILKTYMFCKYNQAMKFFSQLEQESSVFPKPNYVTLVSSIEKNRSRPSLPVAI